MGAGASAYGPAIQRIAENINEDEISEDMANDLETAIADYRKRLSKKNKGTENTRDCMTELLENLGGHETIQALKQKSQQLIGNIEAALPQDSRFLNQSLIYEGMPLEKMLTDAARVKPRFDDFCNHICATWIDQFDLACTYRDAPVKGLPRSEVKVMVELNGKVTQLKDVVRGTIAITGVPDKHTLSVLYDALQHLVDNTNGILPGVRAQIVRMKDRYQKPSGKYHDFLLNMKIHNFICELQINFIAALKQKESEDHKRYEFDRMARANVMAAAMKGDATAVQVMLATGVDINGLKDSNDCTPLAYAAAYGNAEMAAVLLKHGSCPLVIDAAGLLPVQYALSQGQDGAEVGNLIIDHMLTLDLSDSSSQLGIALCAVWSTIRSNPDLKLLEEKAWSLSDLQKPNNDVKFVYASSLGDIEACKHLLELKADVEGGGMYHPQSGFFATAIDWAIMSGGSAPLLALLKEHGARFNKSHSTHAIPQQRALAYASKDEAASLKALLAVEKLGIGLHTPDKVEGKFSVSWGHPQWSGTPLCHRDIALAAAQAGSKKALRRMIQNGFKVTDKEQAVEEQLRVSAGAGDTEMCELLVGIGVDIECCNSAGDTVLCIAACQGCLATCEWLLQQGADASNAGEPQFYTPAHRAAELGRCAVLQTLHQARADFTKENFNGDTPLACAKNAKRTKAVSLIERLLSEG